MLAGCQRAEIEVYSVPKETAFTTSASLHWELPSGWQEVPASGMRAASFLVKGEGSLIADVSIVPLSGRAGSELDNLNRWRGELGLGPITADELPAAGQDVTVCDSQGRLFDIVSGEARLEGRFKERTLAAMTEHGGQTWFFKMRGEADLVAREKDKFIAFLKSIDFHHGEASAAATPSTPAPAVASTEAETARELPQWQIPPGWETEPPTMMVLAAFKVGGGQDGGAKVQVSSFPGDTGGAHANVNRWRAQVGLGPITPEQLPQETAKLDLAGGQAIVADMTGKDAKTGRPTRLIAAIVPRGGHTWFYKLTGDPGVVAEQKEAFLGFVQSARY